jgi:tRNA threonylcarbamoyladenosine biosynthesis protein TsaB
LENKKLKILTIDSTGKMCSVAIKNERKIDFLYNFSYNNHSKIILSMINKILLKQSIILKDINYITVSNGPGSFTGIRISINIAQGFSAGLQIPVIGISTLKILAEQAKRKTLYKNFIVIMQANKKNVYWGKYSFYKEKWHLKKKEIYISNDLAIKKIQKKNDKWKIIGKIDSYILNKINKKNIISKIQNPQAIDIIALTIKIIENKNKISKKIYPNYINNKIV